MSNEHNCHDGCSCHAHNHDHQHNHKHEHDSDNSIEGAIVFSEKKYVAGYETIDQRVAMLLEDVTKWVEVNQGIIGHIKSYVKNPELIMTFSGTGGEIEIKKIQDNEFEIGLTTIVFNVDEKKYKAMVKEKFDNL